MKKFLCLCMAGVTAMMGLAGCASAPSNTTVPATTEAVATQPPEEAKVFKVLLIGQSLGQDTVWLLQQVLVHRVQRSLCLNLQALQVVLYTVNTEQ